MSKVHVLEQKWAFCAFYGQNYMHVGPRCQTNHTLICLRQDICDVRPVRVLGLLVFLRSKSERLLLFFTRISQISHPSTLQRCTKEYLRERSFDSFLGRSAPVQGCSNLNVCRRLAHVAHDESWLLTVAQMISSIYSSQLSNTNFITHSLYKTSS